jgi:hypothetical protein
MLAEKRSSFCAFFGFCMFIVLIVGGAMVKRRAGKEEEEILVPRRALWSCTIHFKHELPCTRPRHPAVRPRLVHPLGGYDAVSRGTNARVSRMHSRANAGRLMW